MGIWFYVIFAVCAHLIGTSIVVGAHFRGSSASISGFITISNTLAMIAMVAICISMFWVAPWWVPIAMLVGIWLFGGQLTQLGLKGNGFIALFCILLYTIGLVALYWMRFA